MPLLDVSDNLLDPDFIQTLTVTRPTQTVDSQGMTQIAETSQSFYGAPVPLTSQELIRNPNAELLAGGIRVYTRFVLDSGSPDTSADIVTFGGKRYTVVSVDDWSNFGAGYVAADCAVISLQDKVDAGDSE
ncbi:MULTISPECIES: hypothetical protein [Komagataeibacter]|uniref:hypothetical protein n=1 Tax=Komagataeibacter TaxID=1434011 RepID=UPI000237EC95|nr:hypothetical protein [Komagataeibacter oboediens]